MLTLNMLLLVAFPFLQFTVCTAPDQTWVGLPPVPATVVISVLISVLVWLPQVMVPKLAPHPGVLPLQFGGSDTVIVPDWLAVHVPPVVVTV